MSTIALAEIPTLALLYKLNKIQPADTEEPDATSRYNDKISLIRNDITKLKTDAIVNAANESLLGGGGVDGAIHQAAGPELVEECETLDGCDTGDAKITNAYELPSKKVIHAVGPVYGYAKRKGMHTTLLQNCYTRSLDLAVENDCKSIAFSALSTGAYGYPSEEAAEAAIGAVKKWLDKDETRAKKLERIVFCQFLTKDEQAYEKYIPKFFSPDPAVTSDTLRKADDENGLSSKGDEATEVVLDLPEPPQAEPADPNEPKTKKRRFETQDDEKH